MVAVAATASNVKPAALAQRLVSADWPIAPLKVRTMFEASPGTLVKDDRRDGRAACGAGARRYDNGVRWVRRFPFNGALDVYAVAGGDASWCVATALGKYD